MTCDYNKLIKLTYEIEGLLTVQLQRGNEALPTIDEMIVEKISELSQLSGTLGNRLTEMPVEAGTKMPAESEVDTMAESQEVKEDESLIASSALDEERMMADEPATEEQSHALSLEEKLARERARDIFRAFTLNDKFRYRRELFHDSQEEFDEALDVISQMSTYDEAEEYIYDDLCWDAENEDVKAFMDVIAKHF